MKGKDANSSISNLKDGRHISFVTDEDPKKWKVSRITANTKIKFAWDVCCWTALAGVWTV